MGEHNDPILEVTLERVKTLIGAGRTEDAGWAALQNLIMTTLNRRLAEGLETEIRQYASEATVTFRALGLDPEQPQELRVMLLVLMLIGPMVSLEGQLDVDVNDKVAKVFENMVHAYEHVIPDWVRAGQDAPGRP